MPKNFYTPETLQDILDRNQKLKKASGMGEQRPWTDFQPQALSYQKPDDMNAYKALQEQTMRNDEEATAIALVKARNQYNFNQLQDQKSLNQTAKNNYIQAQPAQQQTGTYNTGASGQPALSPVKGFNINAGMQTVNWRGHSLTLNRSVIGRFTGFLDALWKKGYRPKSIGSYANRNIAGTNTKSLHSYGLAIDIDPSRNPVTWNGQNITALPPNVGALAAKYGLAWGGAWKGKKRDTMHFSVPYGGTK